ncbi:DUF3558 domain-containing protein [Streptomyces sp. NPDC048057]|uniref:DUF3558 domain-containing protein n=1 Tax=Streptomyces sp. NPDC048057 TaxID=3155628 RepID=UPI0033FD32AE
MRRRTYAARLTAATTAVTALFAAGCTSDGAGATGAVDTKAGAGTTAAAQPGKYRTLPEPCGSVAGSTLKDLLPGVTELADEQQKQLLRGQPVSTYDTDRRVGCSWEAKSPDAAHSLSLDFERVVSYDRAVSDDNRAQQVFEKKQTAAGVPLESAAGGQASKPPTTSSGSPTGTAGTSGAAGSTDAGDLEPRVLDGLGDAAFLDDVVATAGAGSNAQRRTVSVVFRTSNVVVTVVYVAQPGVAAEPPDGKELQEKAQSVARGLVDEFGR